MRLYEEYLLRHDIINVPLVHHCHNGTLILRSTNSSVWANRWVLLKIKWVDHEYRPGHYCIDMNIPIHDGYSKGIIFEKICSVEKKWHEYENFLIDWSSGLISFVESIVDSKVEGLEPITEVKEIIMVAWEMFVFVCDERFTKQPNDIQQKLFATLDKDNSIETRYYYYRDIVTFLSTQQPSILRIWKYEFLEIIGDMQTYADWLAILINKKGR